MTDIKWLKRKYPKHWEEIIASLNQEMMYRIRKGEYRTYKLGRFTDVVNTLGGETYEKGRLVWYKPRKTTDIDYPLIHVITKARTPNVTFSGYHSFNVYRDSLMEL